MQHATNIQLLLKHNKFKQRLLPADWASIYDERLNANTIQAFIRQIVALSIKFVSEDSNHASFTTAFLEEMRETTTRLVRVFYELAARENYEEVIAWIRSTFHDSVFHSESFEALFNLLFSISTYTQNDVTSLQRNVFALLLFVKNPSLMEVFQRQFAQEEAITRNTVRVFENRANTLRGQVQNIRNRDIEGAFQPVDNEQLLANINGGRALQNIRDLFEEQAPGIDRERSRSPPNRPAEDNGGAQDRPAEDIGGVENRPAEPIGGGMNFGPVLRGGRPVPGALSENAMRAGAINRAAGGGATGSMRGPRIPPGERFAGQRRVAIRHMKQRLLRQKKLRS